MRHETKGAREMLGAGIYPITIAEMASYSADADVVFEADEHERLKEFLALHPESGDVIPGTNGVRKLQWPLKPKHNQPVIRVIYYFRDLNMPVYLLALYTRGERINLSAKWREEICQLVDELVEQYRQGWQQTATNLDGSA